MSNIFNSQIKHNLLDELHEGEKIITEEKNKLNNNIKEGFKNYGLLNINWYKNFIMFLADPKNENVNKNLFKYNEIHPKDDERNYTYIDPKFKFILPSNFIFVTENFINLISQYFNNKEKKKLENDLF